MKILVTGGAGFIGSHIVDQCIEAGFDVCVIDNLSTGKKAQVNSAASFYETDINALEIDAIFAKEKPDYVVHHAAQSSVTVSVKDPVADAKSNVTGTIRLLEAAKSNGVKKIVYASSAAIYGEPQYMGIDEKHPIQPMSPYGISKYVPEMYFQTYHKLYGLEYTILRYANVFGERQDPFGEGGVISIFTDKVLRGESLTVFGDGEQTRDFVYVKDVAKANLLALQKQGNQIFNVGTGKPTSLNQLISECNAISGKTLEVHYKEPRRGDIRHSYMNNELITKELQWTPDYTLKQGLESLLATS